MSNGWPLVPLGEALTHRKEFITIDDTQTYKRCRVQMYAKGVVLRDIVSGAEVKTKEQQVCKAGNFLVAEIDAKVGGFGVVPEELDGAIVSSHYFLFSIDETRLEGDFLNYYIRTPDFQSQVTAKGTTNYAAIRPHHVLQYIIPLPPLDEQRHIVAQIEALAAHIEEARGLRRGAVEEAEALLKSARNNVVETLRETCSDMRLGDLCRKITDGPHVSPSYVDQGVPFISVRNITEGGIDFSTAKYIAPEDHIIYSQKANVEKGDVLYTKGGTTGVARRVDTDTQFSIWVHVALLKLKREIVYDGFVEHMLNAPTSKEQAETYTRGSSNRDLGLTRMVDIVFPVPPLPDQHLIVVYLDGLQAEVDALKRVQAETAAELDALLPSVLDKAFKGEL